MQWNTHNKKVYTRRYLFTDAFVYTNQIYRGLTECRQSCIGFPKDGKYRYALPNDSNPLNQSTAHENSKQRTTQLKDSCGLTKKPQNLKPNVSEILYLKTSPTVVGEIDPSDRVCTKLSFYRIGIYSGWRAWEARWLETLFITTLLIKVKYFI